MIERPDVDALLAGPLGGWLEEQAVDREEARALSIRRWWNGAIVALPLIAAGMFLIPIPFDFKVFAAGAICMGVFAWGQWPRRQAIKKVKQGINQAIAQALELDYAAEFKPGKHFGLVREFRMLPKYNRSKFEDLWSGTVAGHGFLLHEAHLEEKRGSGKNRRYVTVFRGVIMAITTSRDVHATTLLERAGKHKGWFGGRKETLHFGGMTLDYVDQVHPDFEEMFAIWSTDQVEARYIADPIYIERLMEIERAFRGKNIRALFHRGEMILAIQTGNNFESGSLYARNDRRKIENTIHQFASLADLALWMNER